jgi:hypothetical protein
MPDRSSEQFNGEFSGGDLWRRADEIRERIAPSAA